MISSNMVLSNDKDNFEAYKDSSLIRKYYLSKRVESLEVLTNKNSAQVANSYQRQALAKSADKYKDDSGSSEACINHKILNQIYTAPREQPVRSLNKQVSS